MSFFSRHWTSSMITYEQIFLNNVRKTMQAVIINVNIENSNYIIAGGSYSRSGKLKYCIFLDGRYHNISI